MINSAYFLTMLVLLISWLYILNKNKNNFLIVGFLIGILYFNILPFLVFLINDGTDNLTIESAKWANHINVKGDILNVIHYFAAIFMGLFSILIYSIIVNKNRSTNLSNRISIKYFYISILLFIGMVFIKENLIPENITHWAKRAQFFNEHYGIYANIFSFFQLGFKYLILIFAYPFLRKKLFATSILLLFVGIFETILSGNRIFFLIIMIILFYELVMQHRYKIIIYSSIIAFPFIFLMTLWPYIRATMSYMPLSEAISKAIDNFSINTSIFNYLIFNATEGADFLVSYTILQDFPLHYNYFCGSSIFKVFTYIIPRSIWEDKWDSISLEMAHIYNPDISGFSLNTTLIGESYANLGMLGIFIFFLFSLFFYGIFNNLTNKIDKRIDTDIIYFGIGFQTMRSNFSDMALIVISITIFLFLFRILRRKHI